MENNYQEKLKQQLYDGIQIKATLVGKSQMTSGNEYKIRLEHNGKFVVLPYHTNINDIVDKQDIVECLLIESEAYENTMDVTDFADTFGYADYIKAKKAYQGCKKQSERLRKLFDDNEIAILQESI